MSRQQGPEFGQLLIRLSLGFCFLMHGMQKAFGLFGHDGIGAFQSYLLSMDVILPELSAIAVAYGELFSGIALLVGFFHRSAAVIVLVIMSGAILLQHSNGYFGSQGGCEYQIALMAMAVLILLAGPGPMAYRFEFKKNKE